MQWSMHARTHRHNIPNSTHRRTAHKYRASRYIRTANPCKLRKYTQALSRIDNKITMAELKNRRGSCIDHKIVQSFGLQFEDVNQSLVIENRAVYARNLHAFSFPPLLSSAVTNSLLLNRLIIITAIFCLHSSLLNCSLSLLYAAHGTYFQLIIN